MTRLSIPFVISKGIRLVSLESTAELNLQFLPVRCSLPKNTCGFDHTFVQNVWQVRKMTFVPIFGVVGDESAYPFLSSKKGAKPFLIKYFPQIAGAPRTELPFPY